jgi:hypothetical protein
LVCTTAADHANGKQQGEANGNEARCPGNEHSELLAGTPMFTVLRRSYSIYPGFPFWLPGRLDYTSDSLKSDPFLLIIPSQTTSAAQEGPTLARPG